MLRRPERTTSWSSAMRILVIGFSLARIVEQLLRHGHRWKPRFGQKVNADITVLVHRTWSRGCGGSSSGPWQPPLQWLATRGPESGGRRGLVHRYDDVDPRTPSAGSDPEVTAELVDPRLDAADANAGTKIRAVTLHGTRHTMSVVRDHHVDPTRDPAQLDRHM